MGGAVRQFEALLHGLHVFGALGISAFGWGLCELIGWSSWPWWLLWFWAALLIYNVDRLRTDPADLINVPLRLAVHARYRTVSLTVLVIAGLFLVLWPVWTRDWLTLALVGLGAMVCLNYSIPLLGFRFKEVPGLKTFFAPSVVALAIVGLPGLHGQPCESGGLLAVGALQGWGILLFNMTLCDLRDVQGDRSTGVRSLPVLLGPLGTRRFLLGLLATILLLLLVAIWLAGGRIRSSWVSLGLLVPLYLGALLRAVRKPQSERFYELWVEGLLFLPAVAVLLGRLW